MNDSRWRFTAETCTAIFTLSNEVDEHLTVLLKSRNTARTKML